MLMIGKKVKLFCLLALLFVAVSMLYTLLSMKQKQKWHSNIAEGVVEPKLAILKANTSDY
jgi:hypothetical protein